MSEPWVIFRLGDQRYCTEATSIREIITYRPASPVPGAPPGVEGIINVRKDKITLFSGSYLVEHRESKQQDSGHIILLEWDDHLFGVAVDGVDGIVELDPRHIDPGSVAQDNAVLGTIPCPNQERQQDSQHPVATQAPLLTAVSLATFCENAVANQDL